MLKLGHPGCGLQHVHIEVYRISQEEGSIFWEVIVSAILSKKYVCSCVLFQTVSKIELLFTFIGCILLYIYFVLFLYIEVSRQNNFSIVMKQNRHYCVNICFYCIVGIRYMFQPPLLGHLQALSITIRLLKFNMNSYCAHYC
jgi:fucose 4-O-acetylase-like acetyltransferase